MSRKKFKMRKVKIDNVLIEKIKNVLDEIECLEPNFDNYSKERMVECALTEPNYYDSNEFEPLEDFYNMNNMNYNKEDNTITFEIDKYADIFLQRLEL